MRWKIAVPAVLMAVSLLLTQGNLAFAHEWWFVDEGTHAGEYHSFGLTNLLVVLGAAALVGLAVVFDRSGWSRKLDAFFEMAGRMVPRGIEWRGVAVLAGVMLIGNAVTGVYLAHNLVMPTSGLVLLGGIAQVAVGVLFISQITFLLPGLLVLLVALPLAAFSFSPALLVDYVVELTALGLAFVFFGLAEGYVDRRLARRIGLDPSRYSHLPVPIIRIGVGVTLAILAFHNKLLNPDAALTFLDEYNFNFMPFLGFTGFTNLQFVFAAGVVEVTLALLLISGIATRLSAAAIAGMLITTAAILGPVELLGHLPLLGIAVLLVWKGAGQYRLARPRPGKVPA